MQNDQKPFQTTNAFHLAGIIPIAGQPLDYEMDFPDCMMPISKNYTLIEHAVYECAMAGCETIWLVCNDDVAPLIRHRVGDYIVDPVSLNRMSRFPSHERVQIPIFYVPIHPKDRDKRDCLSWSVIHGALTSLKVATTISKWLIPDKYYVSFPYGVFPVEELRPQRKLISNSKNFYVTSEGRTAMENFYCSFTFGKDEFIKYRRNIRKKGTGMYTMAVVDERGIPRHKLPVEQRYSARFFELADVFTGLDLEEATTFEPSGFANVSSWEEYKNYVSSDLSSKITRPWKGIMTYREFNPIGVDPEEV
jgi:hypothetical protein